MLRVNVQSFTYPGGETAALRDSRVSIAAGEIVGLVGANGSGKTTLCLVAAGVAPRWTGGKLDGGVEEDDSTRSGSVGLVSGGAASQFSGQAETVFEEVAFGPMNLGLSASVVRERTAAAMSLLNLEGLAERDPLKLSGGQQQLVVLASVLAMRHRYLVADEPVGELDPSARRLVGDALARLAAQGLGILLVEHDTALLERLCTRVAVLARGQIVSEAATMDILNHPDLETWGVSPAPLSRLRRLTRT